MRKTILGIFFSISLSLFLRAEVQKEIFDAHNAGVASFDSNQQMSLDPLSGKLGIVYRDVFRGQQYLHRLLFWEIFPNGKRQKKILLSGRDSFLPPLNASPAYDQKSQAHIFSLSSGVYRHFYQKEDQKEDQKENEWCEEELFLPSEGLEEGEKREWKHCGVTLGRDGFLHVLAQGISEKRKTLVFAHGIWREGKVDFSLINVLHKGDDLRRVFNFQVDSKGSLHLVYNLDRHLYYSEVKKNHWKAEVVLKRKNFDTEAAWNAFLALDNRNIPHIASTLIQRVSTGSFRYAHLLLHDKKEGRWRSQTLVKKSAGYSGTDGVSYTGHSPCLTFDHKNRAHLLFTDIASWHKNGNNDRLPGQLRYFVQGKKRWHESIIYAQKGQAQQGKPLEGILHPCLAVSPDGQKSFSWLMELTVYSQSNIHDYYARRRYQSILLEWKNSFLD